MNPFSCQRQRRLGSCLSVLLGGCALVTSLVVATLLGRAAQAGTAVTHAVVLQPIGQVAGDYSVVVVSGTLAYLGGHNGLTIFEISQPTQPVTLTHLATAQPIQDLKVVSNLVYLAQGVYDPYQ